MKKSLPIENLLRWTYRDELPKEQATISFLRPVGFKSGWGAVTKAGIMGVEVQEPDIRNKYGLVPDFTAHADPHPDAVAVWHAVGRLGELHLDLPADWNPLSDMGDLGAEGPAAVTRALSKLSVTVVDGSRHLREGYEPAFLVRRSAIMGPPGWVYEKPERKFVSAHGQPRWFIRETVVTEQGSFEVEVDGFDRTKRRPKTGAYRRAYLDPDPMEAAIGRAEYEIWVAALGVLADDLRGRLDEHEVQETALAPRPWEAGAPKVARVLVDRKPASPRALRGQRPLAGPPPDRMPESIRFAEKERRAAERAAASTPIRETSNVA